MSEVDDHLKGTCADPNLVGDCPVCESVAEDFDADSATQDAAPAMAAELVKILRRLDGFIHNRKRPIGKREALKIMRSIEAAVPDATQTAIATGEPSQ